MSWKSFRSGSGDQDRKSPQLCVFGETRVATFALLTLITLWDRLPEGL
jgi:hypothetical protein